MKRTVATAIVGLLVMISAALNLSFALRSGSLSRPPVYDDVAYLLDAYQRLAFGGVHSLGTLVRSFLTDPPHAPMSTLTAMLGYSLIGPYLWAAYAANVWMLGLFAAAVYLVARRNIDRIPSILVVTLMLFVPAAHALITEFRPDQGAGVILACALYSLVSTDYPKATRPRLVALGSLVACAVMAKPTAIVATVPVLGLAAAIGILCPGYYSGSEAIYSVRAAIPAVAVAIAILIPCVVLWGPGTYAYIYQALVTNKDMWGADGGQLYHWMSNSFGADGRRALGPFLWLGLSCILVDALLSFPAKPSRSLRYARVLFRNDNHLLRDCRLVTKDGLSRQPFLLSVSVGNHSCGGPHPDADWRPCSDRDHWCIAGNGHHFHAGHVVLSVLSGIPGFSPDTRLDLE